ncbi:MAG TPA: glycine--tRNA ligase subunit beta, partial [Candidatus Eisenbacteria bacterium]|nr:glycine--tRNA ligase subunit beta [Candidatus Eisenbacteria bacterium]
MSRDLLFEIGCEELPASFIAPALSDLERAATEGLAEARLAHGPLRALGTPRRLALLVESVADRQGDRVREVTGPAVKVAYDAAGNPTNAAKGFAKGAGIAVEALERVVTPKGEYLLARVNDVGLPAADVLPELLGGSVQGLRFPKTMHWNGAGRFARPVRWMVAVFGEDILPVAAFGVVAGRRTRGHRIHAPAWIDVARPADYVAVLREHVVMVEIRERRSAIESELTRAAATVGGIPIQDAELLEEVTNLVEWPEAVVGSFDE